MGINENFSKFLDRTTDKWKKTVLLYTTNHFPVRDLFFFFMECTGVTLGNKTTQVSGAQFYNTSPVRCTVCSPSPLRLSP